MPYYHIQIRYKAPETGRESTRHELNLSEEEMKLLVEQFQKAKALFDGKWINSRNIKQTEIRETSQKTTYHFPSLRPSTIFGNPLFKDVTRQFMKSPPEEKIPEKTKRSLSKNVFIVHGRDHKAMQELKTMLRELGLKPVVLHEQPSGSMTIVEKLEKYSDVGYTFVILTPDDIGVSWQDLFEKTAKSSYDDEAPSAARRILAQSKGSMERFIEFNMKFMQDPADASKFLEFLDPRARQNVVLEFGYFMGLLGRDRVCCLHKGDVELPSDMHGIVYISFKESVDEVRDEIINELKGAGYKDL